MIDRAPIRTARLLLQPVEPSMAEAIWEATRASLPELSRWLPWAPEASLEGTRAFTEDAVRHWGEGTDYVFALLLDGSAAGSIGLHTARDARPLGEIGYWVRTDLTGAGYVTEAGAAVVRFGFEQLGLTRIELRAGVDNQPSQRVAERLGFHREGLLRKGCPHPDGGYDCYIYGLLPEDIRGA